MILAPLLFLLAANPTKQSASTSPSDPQFSPLNPSTFVTIGDATTDPSRHLTILSHRIADFGDFGKKKVVPVFKHDRLECSSDGASVVCGGGDWEAGEGEMLYGLLGVVQVERTACVVAIRNRLRIGSIPKSDGASVEKVPIYKVETVTFIAVHGGPVPQSPLLEPVRELVQSGWYYADGGHNLARRWTAADEDVPTSQDTNNGFQANHLMAEAALAIGFPESMLVKAIYGDVAISVLPVGDDDELTVALLSRTLTLNFGTRYKARGCNRDGHCANTVESEQVIVVELSCDVDGFGGCDGGTTITGTSQSASTLQTTRNRHKKQKTLRTVSHVQLRGSVPLQWSEGKDIKIDGTVGLQQHLDWLAQRYPKQRVHMLSLLEGKVGHRETALNTCFAFAMRKHHNSSFTHHPYHTHITTAAAAVDQDEWKRKIVNALGEIADCGATLVVDGVVVMEAVSVIRTNSLDCMDRTSNTQYALLSASLFALLTHSLFPPPSHNQHNHHSLTPLSLFDSVCDTVKQQWTGASTAISIHYSGTVAQQNQMITRGMQTLVGQLMGGMTSFMRPVQWQIYDEPKNAAMQLVFSGSVCGGGLPSPMESGRESPVASRRTPKKGSDSDSDSTPPSTPAILSPAPGTSAPITILRTAPKGRSRHFCRENS